MKIKAILNEIIKSLINDLSDNSQKRIDLLVSKETAKANMILNTIKNEEM